jgi:hypothetical protein
MRDCAVIGRWPRPAAALRSSGRRSRRVGRKPVWWNGAVASEVRQGVGARSASPTGWRPLHRDP